jgi:alkanesulfonate monooxygenase SsuD/methylene tetrahydromethanopterin reductase-like flavin-dependent oxidoreductase (luciferase family)
LASLDVLSGGRLTFGVGVGYLRPEFAAIGANYDERGAVTDDYLAAMASLWYDEHPEHHGRFSDFAGIDAHPRPVQRPIPVVIGGHSAPAYRRAVASGQGWYGFAQTPEDTATSIEGLRRAADQVDRPAHLGELEISVTPRVPVTAETAAAFAELGVDRLVPMPRPGATEADTDALMADVAAVVTAG